MVEENNKPEELIDVSEFENELSDDALTEIARESEEEELTPIKHRAEPPPPAIPGTSPTLSSQPSKKGTFVATLRERFAEFFIDTLLLFYVYWILVIFYGRLFLGSWNAEIPYSGWHALGLHGAFLTLCFLYYFVLEGIFLATFGKFVCWMSVRKKNGDPASLISTFVRNLLRPLDYILIIPAAFIMELTKYRQRIGDLIAGTTVVKKFGTSPQPYSVLPNRIATASGRTFAIVIDMILFCGFLAGYILILSPSYPFISRWILLLSPVACMAYFILIEMITETSPGKWLMGYITCHDNGRRLTISGSIVRTIWRLFDTNPIGLICVYISSNRQRPGDTAAGTVVIKSGRTTRGAASILIAIVLTATTLYFGLTNGANILSQKFNWSFLPKIGILNQLGFSDAPRYENIVLEHFRFAVDDPSNLRVPPTFTPGETIYILFELAGYKKVNRRVWLQEDLAVKYPDGTIGLKQDNIVDYLEIVKGDGPIELTNNITLPQNANAGDYEVLITIRDKFGGRELKETKSFFVKGSDLD